MKIQLTYNNIIIYIIALILVTSIPNISYAYRAEHPAEDVAVVCNKFCEDTNRTLMATGVKGNLRFEVESRKFHLVRSDNNQNLNKNGSSIPLGTTLTFTTFNERASNAKGDWFFVGGAYDSPPMDNQWYRYIVYANNGEERRVRFRADYPNNNNPISIEGSGNVSCQNNRCNTTGIGDARITITFASDRAFFQSQRFFASSGGWRDQDEEQLRYKRAVFTYNFTVFQTNNSHTVACLDPNNITADSVRARWSYNDPDGDPQTLAQVDIATDAGFNNIVRQSGISGEARNLTIDGLSINTRYFIRVRARNAVNGWSNWQTCPNSFRTLNNRLQRVNYRNTTGITETTAIANWNYSDLDGDPQTEATVELSTDSNFSNPNNIISRSISNNNTSLTINGLSSGVKYYPRVRARNAVNGWSDWAYGSAFTTGLNVNNPPTVIYENTNGITDTSARANWTYSDPDIDPQDEAIVQLSINSNFVTDIRTFNINGSNTKTFMSGLNPGTTYYPRVRVKDSQNNWSDWSYGSEFTTNVNLTEDTLLGSGPIPTPFIPIPPVNITCEALSSFTSFKNGEVKFRITVEGLSEYDWGISINGSGPISFQRKTGQLIDGHRFEDTKNYSAEGFGVYNPSLFIKKPGDTRLYPPTSCGPITNISKGIIKEIR
jgi:hypothetical protein